MCEQLSVGTTSAQALTEQSRAAAESSANVRRAALVNNSLDKRDDGRRFSRNAAYRLSDGDYFLCCCLSLVRH